MRHIAKIENSRRQAPRSMDFPHTRAVASGTGFGARIKDTVESAPPARSRLFDGCEDPRKPGKRPIGNSPTMHTNSSRSQQRVRRAAAGRMGREAADRRPQTVLMGMGTSRAPRAANHQDQGQTAGTPHEVMTSRTPRTRTHQDRSRGRRRAAASSGWDGPRAGRPSGDRPSDDRPRAGRPRGRQTTGAGLGTSRAPHAANHQDRGRPAGTPHEVMTSRTPRAQSHQDRSRG